MIREPQEKDLDSVFTLCKQIYITNRKYGREMPEFVSDFDTQYKFFLKQWMAQNNALCLVSVEDEKVNGFIGGYHFMDPPFFAKPSCFMISFISIDPAFQRRDIASQLFIALKKKVLHKYPDLCQLEVEVLKGNIEAESFWNHQGFRDFKIRLIQSMWAE